MEVSRDADKTLCWRVNTPDFTLTVTGSQLVLQRGRGIYMTSSSLLCHYPTLARVMPTSRKHLLFNRDKVRATTTSNDVLQQQAKYPTTCAVPLAMRLLHNTVSIVNRNVAEMY